MSRLHASFLRLRHEESVDRREVSLRPAMLADMQRARILTWQLRNFGWEPEILALRAAEILQDAVRSDNPGSFPSVCVVDEVGSFCRLVFNNELGEHPSPDVINLMSV